METALFIIFISVAAGAFVLGVLGFLSLFCSSDDLKAAGVHTDQTKPVNFEDLYREPIGFEPAGVRDTFVPPPVDGLTTDEFISHLVDIGLREVVPTTDDLMRDINRAASMLVHARDILGSCYEAIPDPRYVDDESTDELRNRITNWLMRGHED